MNPNGTVPFVCRVCDGLESHTLLQSGSYSLKTCASCSLVSLHPLPTEPELNQYYDQNYWRRDTVSPEAKRLYDMRMKWVIRDLATMISPGGRLLDVGAGDGAWVRLSRRAGFDAWGLDRYASSTSDDRLKQGTLESAQFPAESFDGITFFHVLEHLNAPLDALREAHRVLKPGGIVVIEVPNIDSWGFRIFGYRWQPLEIPTHFNFFTPKTLCFTLSLSGGWQVLKVSHFSLRASPAALVLSKWPFLQPKKVRCRTGGSYPFSQSLVYLGLQVAAMPLVLLSARAKEGCIIRLYARKTGGQ